MPYLFNFSESFKAVCPPSWTITPIGFSCKIISYKCSQKTGSKYNLSAISKSAKKHFPYVLLEILFISNNVSEKKSTFLDP